MESLITKFSKVADDIVGSLVWNLMSPFGIQNFEVPTVCLENMCTIELHHLLLMQCCISPMMCSPSVNDL